MFELEQGGFFPLTRETLKESVPCLPGVYTFAVKSIGGKYKSFTTKQSDNLYSSLLKVLDSRDVALPSIVAQQKAASEYYFTFFVILKEQYRHEVEKMFTYTTDPINKLKIINAN